MPVQYSRKFKFIVPTANDYRDTYTYINSSSSGRLPSTQSFAFHEEKQVCIVVRNIPHDIDTDDILCDLKEQKIPVDAIYRKHRSGGAPYKMVLIVCIASRASTLFSRSPGSSAWKALKLRNPTEVASLANAIDANYTVTSNATAMASRVV